jgi:hypothetical protein
MPDRFLSNWHLRVLCDFLTDPSSGLRRVVNVPPSTGKSSITGIFWPAWVWTTDPWVRWMFISYGEDTLNRDSDKLIQLLASKWYVERWGPRLKSKVPPVSNFEILGGGRKFNTSFGGAGTGWHAHKQVIDDPIKPADAASVTGVVLDSVWDTIGNTFGSRALDLSTFERTIIGQRVHEGRPLGPGS